MFCIVGSRTNPVEPLLRFEAIPTPRLIDRSGHFESWEFVTWHVDGEPTKRIRVWRDAFDAGEWIEAHIRRAAELGLPCGSFHIVDCAEVMRGLPQIGGAMPTFLMDSDS